MADKKQKVLRDFRTAIPECESDNYEVKRFKISEKDASFFNLRCAINRQSERNVISGEYTKLTLNGSSPCIMSDTPAELMDHASFIEKASGNILLNGLGLGVALDICLAKTYRQPYPQWSHHVDLQTLSTKPMVKHATVIEKSQELIDLVSPYYLNLYPGRVTVICSDALSYKPPKNTYYNAVWHDIWFDIRGDNLSDMHRLHRVYGSRCAWQGSWSRSYIE